MGLGDITRVQCINTASLEGGGPQGYWAILYFLPEWGPETPLSPSQKNSTGIVSQEPAGFTSVSPIARPGLTFEAERSSWEAGPLDL